MCGIVGIVGAGRDPELEPRRVGAAVRALRHRGPDGCGLWEDGSAVLGHTRLGIVDLDGGAQPMCNEDGTVVTVFNGEIWNHVRLRRELERCGHRFASRSDTEVLVHGYEEWGEELPGRLDGMFAFAVWDVRAKRLLLARDRLGKKPLYVARDDGALAFGSDARAVLLALGRRPELDRARLPEFLFHRYLAGDRTLFRGVRRLEPGRLLVWDGSGLRRRTYWALEPSEPLPLEPSELSRLLREAVSQRLMADVPIGALLSGGVDSSALVALARRLDPRPFATFTVGFAGGAEDERAVARATAAELGTDHHELVVEAGAFVEALPRLAWYRDEPVAEPSEIPLLLLAEFAARHVKVVLSGDGGDELFGGYPKYRAERVLAVPGSAAVVRAALRLAGLRTTHRRLDRAAATLAVRDDVERWASWFRSFSPLDLGTLLVPELAAAATSEELVRPLVSEIERFAKADRISRMLAGDLLTYLPGNMLLRTDKVLMAASLEGRLPLLDHRLVERVSMVPAADRAGLRAGKRLLRAAVAEVVPAAVLRQPKRGFPVPVARLLVDRADGLVERLLLSERALERGLFEPAAVRALVRGSVARPARDLQLFTLVSLELWLRANVDELRTEPPSAEDLFDGCDWATAAAPAALVPAGVG